MPALRFRLACCLALVAIADDGRMSPAGAECNAESPRLYVPFYTYAGTDAGEEQKAFDRYRSGVSKVVKDANAALARQDPILAYIENIRVDNQLPKANFPNNKAEDDFWIGSQSLIMLDGTLSAGAQNRFDIESWNYLGQLSGDLGSPSVTLHLDSELSGFARAKDAHLLIAYYALAMDARRIGCPASSVIALLVKASDKVKDLQSKQYNDPVVAEIDRAINQALDKLK
jgi:hypothetical protein